MKKIICIILFLLITGTGTFTQAELQVLSHEDLNNNSIKYQEQTDRKLYFSYESTYSPDFDDSQLLDQLDTALNLLHNRDSQKLRDIYSSVSERLKELGASKRDGNGGTFNQKDSRVYFLLEQINNKISDLPGNQDLGCIHGLAHMEGDICFDNTKTIRDDTGSGYQKYDFINGIWNNVMMTNCNNGYEKQETTYNGKIQVLCIND